MPDSHRWFVVLDSQKARLCRGSRTPKGSTHLEEVSALANTFAAGQHHRPDRMGSPGRGGSGGHEHEEKIAHFAREVAPWLQKELDRLGAVRCALFAPAHTLGALRKCFDKSLAARIDQHEVELAGLPIAQLGTHPRIAALLAD